MKQEFKDGVYNKLHNDIYREAEGLSQSELMGFEKDPHYFQRTKRHKSKNMLFGSLLDSLLFDDAETIGNQYLVALTIETYKNIKYYFDNNKSFYKEINGIYTEIKIPKKLQEIDFEHFFKEERLLVKSNNKNDDNSDIEDEIANRDIIGYEMFCQALAMLEGIQNKFVYVTDKYGNSSNRGLYTTFEKYTKQVSIFASYKNEISDEIFKLKGRLDLCSLVNSKNEVIDIIQETPSQNTENKTIKIMDFKTIGFNSEKYITDEELLEKIFLDRYSDYVFQLLFYKKLLELNGFTEENNYKYMLYIVMVHANTPYDTKIINISEIISYFNDKKDDKYEEIQINRLNHLLDKYHKYKADPERKVKDTNYFIDDWYIENNLPLMKNNDFQLFTKMQYKALGIKKMINKEGSNLSF